MPIHTFNLKFLPLFNLWTFSNEYTISLDILGALKRPLVYANVLKSSFHLCILKVANWFYTSSLNTSAPPGAH